MMRAVSLRGAALLLPLLDGGCVAIVDGNKISAHLDDGTIRQREVGVVGGTAQQVGYHYQVNPDCTPKPPPAVRLTAPPAHGQVSFVTKDQYPDFAAGNPRAKCNVHPVPASTVLYTPIAGYIGTDAFEVTIVFDNDPIDRDEYTAQILQ